MDMFYIPALASFSGSASGTLASIVTGWVTQRRKDRVRHTLRATSQREELYKGFIEEASRLYADALVNDKSEVSKLVDLYALIARMKILSSDAVIEAAEKAGRSILETYLSPNRTFVDLPELIKEMDPLRDFSEACRRELQSARPALRLSDHAAVSVFRLGGKLSSRGAPCRELVLLRTDCPAPRSDVPLDQKINIRIHTDHKWPERVVFDTTRSTLAREAKADPETDVGRSETPVQAERQPFDAFAEMAIPVRPCFRPPCSAGQVADRDANCEGASN